MIAQPLVVVGVDGSECSLKALRFAVNEARMRNARLRIVTAWRVPVMAFSTGYTPAIDPATFKHAASETSAEALKQAHQLAADVEIHAVTPDGPPTEALMSAAEGADLLVVGSRGHGGFARLLLGSVSAQLAQHSPCPITVIHAGTNGK